MSTTNSDAVKEIVYAHIDALGREAVRAEFSSGHGEGFLSGAASACLGDVRGLGLGAAGDSVMLTVILHFALSAAAVPSHRKVGLGGTEVDIVVPDVRTLRSSPASALVIAVPAAEDAAAAGRAADSMLGVQPDASNIAVALVPGARGMKYASYSVEDSTFQNIVRDARRFLGRTGGVGMGITGA